ncbi:uncharacterized protein HGUI_00376 [Hanseniaspora guilliermondii]|uniref:Trafficking protein particle complex subunit n=1 Tax=Hanseniaspora guilliermondii TaxID=56406 RepID=A0A1L0AVM7_9ASCO|nr:uncharacterized protein HGUI_00376 [Hanseniaspora guilliermondii]
MQQQTRVLSGNQRLELSKYDMNFMSLYYSEMINTVISLFVPSEHIHNYHIKYLELPEDTQQQIIQELRSLGDKIGHSLAKVSKTEKNTLVQNIKCLCKEIYPCMYQRPIDSLKTNHKGDYYLVDKSFDFSYKNNTKAPLYVLYHVFACSIMKAFMNSKKDVQYKIDDDDNHITYIINME